MTQRLASPPWTRLATRAAPGPDAYFRSLADQSDGAVLVVEPATGLCRHANLRAAEITGWSRDDLARRSLAELIAVAEAPDVLDQVYATLGTPWAAARTLLNVPLRTRAGKVLPVDLRVAGVLTAEAHTTALLIIAQPASRRLLGEASELRRAHSLAALDRLAAAILHPEAAGFERLLEDCARFVDADGTALYLVTTDPPGLELCGAVNLPAAFPAGLGASEVQGALAPSAWHTGQRPDWTLARAARLGGWSALLAHPLADGSASSGLLLAGFRAGRAPVNDAPMLLGVAARLVSTFLSQHTLAQSHQAAAAQAARIACQSSVIYDAVSDGVLMLNADGIVTDINAAGRSLLGYSAEEVIGSHTDEVLVSLQPLTEIIRDTLTRAVASGESEARLLKRDGREFPARVQCLPIAGEAGRALGAAVLFADITDRKAFEAQTQHLEQRAYLGDMSAIFAHEIRNPLNGISMGLELMASRLPPGDGLHDTIGKIQSEANRVEQLLRDVLLVAKPAEMSFELTDAQKFVERILNRFSPRLARRQVDLARHFIPGTPPAMMDARMMEQVLINLIENALQAMGESGGSLSVTVGPAALDNTVEPQRRMADELGYVQVDIGDTGPGISPEVQKRVFEPFFTTRSEGTGLGLTIARRFVQVHRGRLTVQSWPNVGTIFTILIPVARAPTRSNEVSHEHSPDR